jgi:hypothetical protein
LTFQGQSRVSLRWRNFRETKHQKKTTENVGKIRELIHEDSRRTIHELADTVGISYGVCQQILTKNVNMRRIAPSTR